MTRIGVFMKNATLQMFALDFAWCVYVNFEVYFEASKYDIDKVAPQETFFWGGGVQSHIMTTEESVG